MGSSANISWQGAKLLPLGLIMLIACAPILLGLYWWSLAGWMLGFVGATIGACTGILWMYTEISSKRLSIIRDFIHGTWPSRPYVPQDAEISSPAQSAVESNQGAATAMSAPRTIQVGEYYIASTYLDVVFIPPTIATASICAWLFFERPVTTIFLILMTMASCMILRYSYGRYAEYFCRSISGEIKDGMPVDIELIEPKKYGFLAGVAAFSTFMIFMVLEQQRPNYDWDMFITHFTLLGVWFLWSVLFYAQRWLRLVEWSKRRDYSFFEMGGDDKLPRDMDAARGQQQAWSNQERRYMARLRRYKCSSVLARHIILVNIAAFHFATAARHKEYPFYVSLSDGLWLLLFLVVAQCLWWRFIRGDKIIKDPIHVMETSSRLLVDFEWLAALFVIPCSLLTYSLLDPTRGLLADESMLYFSMLSVQVALFFIILYPGRIPAGRFATRVLESNVNGRGRSNT